MIGGQSADLNGSDLRTRDCKTSALMRLTLTAGAQAGGASVSSVALLAECGEHLGQAYQMLDDLNDTCCDSGKTVAQDQRHHRPAWNVSRDAILAEVADCRQLLTNSFGSAAGRPCRAATAGPDRRVPLRRWNPLQIHLGAAGLACHTEANRAGRSGRVL
jgi:hypothetical protein